MASVRLSRDLRSTIQRNAVQAFDVSTPEPQHTSVDLEYIIDRITCNKTQTAYAEIANAFDSIATYKPHWGYHNNRGRYAFGFTAPVRTKVTAVTIVLDDAAANDRDNQERISLPRSVELYSADDNAVIPIEVFDDPTTREKIRNIVKTYRERYIEYREKRYQYSETIANLLAECTTLKQFLTAWPAGESFVPQDKLNELHTKVTRIQKARQIKEDIQFDDTAVNQVVLTSKLMGN